MKETIEKDTFVKKLNAVKKVKSIRGIVYSNFQVRGAKCYGIRESTGSVIEIDIEKLYEGYSTLTKSNVEINTKSLKKYITNRMQSPAYAILRYMGLA